MPVVGFGGGAGDEAVLLGLKELASLGEGFRESEKRDMMMMR